MPRRGSFPGLDSSTPRLAPIVLSLVLLAAGCAQKGAEEEATEETGGGPVTLTLLSPAPGDTVAGPSVEVRFQLDNYEVYFDSTKMAGQHIHFILDNEPYIPHYAREPFVFANVPPGTHTIRAFPSREWHESIKDSTAFAMVTFHMDHADGKNAPDPRAPLLTYSRPKGDYAGDMAKRVMVDYWIKNCTLGQEAYRVRMRVDETAREFIQWEPYWLEGLAPGEHRISLELIGPDGAQVEGPFNATQRVFTVSP